MTALGERILEFLRSQPDVLDVKDYSRATLAGRGIDEAITCRLNGAGYEVRIDPR